jgi:DNA-binding MurR/RpiR family transcriptional regulator
LNESVSTVDNETLIQKISKAALDNSPALQRVGVWMATHPLRVISMSADDVAVQAGASLAAVNRFARSAGFDGFAHLKATLAEELHEASEPIRKLRSADEVQTTLPNDGRIASLLEAERNVRLTR